MNIWASLKTGARVLALEWQKTQFFWISIVQQRREIKVLTLENQKGPSFYTCKRPWNQISQSPRSRLPRWSLFLSFFKNHWDMALHCQLLWDIWALWETRDGFLALENWIVVRHLCFTGDWSRLLKTFFRHQSFLRGWSLALECLTEHHDLTEHKI